MDSISGFPVLCAWCQSKGQRTVIRMVDYPDSHGICDICFAGEMKELRREFNTIKGEG